MRRRSREAWLIAACLGIGLAVVLFSQAQAQYPPPNGNVLAAAEDTTPGLGEEIAVSATVQDEDGVPAVGVECTFNVTQQPGDDASVVAGPFTTDATGRVSTTLATGSTQGTIVVEVACGELSAQVSVVAGAAAPPGSLPDTGTGPTDPGGTNWPLWALIGGFLAAGLGGLAIAWRLLKP